MEIKDWVKAARQLKGWNQTQLGDVVGRTKGNVGHWETGKHTPSLEHHHPPEPPTEAVFFRLRDAGVEQSIVFLAV